VEYYFPAREGPRSLSKIPGGTVRWKDLDELFQFSGAGHTLIESLTQGG
jgi:hypothetical protein